MNGADRGSEPEWPVRRGQGTLEKDTGVAQRRGFRISPVFLALGAILLLLLVIWFFAATRDEDQDKLINPSTGTSATADPAKICSRKATYDLIKRELFRRAAQVRGSDQSAFERLSSYTTLRMENSVMESEDSGTGAMTVFFDQRFESSQGCAGQGDFVGGEDRIERHHKQNGQPCDERH